MGAVTAVFYFPSEGWFDAYWIVIADGEECESVDIGRTGVPESVRTIARLMHKALGRPCPWESETAS